MANGTYTYDARNVHIFAISPSVGSTVGGDVVTVSGEGFISGGQLLFDGAPASPYGLISSYAASGATPSHAEGTVDVAITFPDGSFTIASGAYRYENPSNPSGFWITGYNTDPDNTRHGITIKQTFGQAGECNFRTTDELVGMANVSIIVRGVELFQGNISNTINQQEGDSDNPIWAVTALDQWWQFDRTRPVGEWVDESISVVVAELVQDATGFTYVFDEFPPGKVSLKLDGTTPRSAALRQACQQAGGSYCADGWTIHIFVTNPSLGSADTLDDGNQDLIRDGAGQACAISWDYTQITNRVTIRGLDNVSVTLEDSHSISLYGVREDIPAVDPSLTKASECALRAQNILDNYALPIPTIRYATRDLKTKVGRKVSVNLTIPFISGDFFIHDVEVDQINEVGPDPEFSNWDLARPRFTATATAIGIAPAQTFDAVVGKVISSVDTPPTLTGAVTTNTGDTTGTKTVILDGSISAGKLAGCLPTDLQTPGPVKDPVVTTSEGEITLSGLQTINGIQLTAGDRVLVNGQTNATENGIYLVVSGAVWARTTDADEDAQVIPGILVVDASTGVLRYLDATPPVVVGTTDLNFLPIVASGAMIASGAILADGSVVFTADQSMGSHRLTHVADPSAAQDAATKAYVDIFVASGAVLADGSIPFTADQSMGSHKLTNVTDPTSAQDAATKNYVDTHGGSGGGLVLLEQHTASSSSSLDFTTFSSTYDEYVFEFLNILPATDNVDFLMRCSTDGGSSYDSGNNYEYADNLNNTGNFATPSVSSASASAVKISPTMDFGGTTGGFCGSLKWFNPLGSVHKIVVGQGAAYLNDNQFYNHSIGGRYKSTSAVDAVRFLMSSGNIASGTIRLYGVAK